MTALPATPEGSARVVRCARHGAPLRSFGRPAHQARSCGSGGQRKARCCWRHSAGVCARASFWSAGRSAAPGRAGSGGGAPSRSRPRPAPAPASRSLRRSPGPAPRGCPAGPATKPVSGRARREDPVRPETIRADLPGAGRPPDRRPGSAAPLRRPASAFHEGDARADAPLSGGTAPEAGDVRVMEDVRGHDAPARADECRTSVAIWLEIASGSSRRVGTRRARARSPSPTRAPARGTARRRPPRRAARCAAPARRAPVALARGPVRCTPAQFCWSLP